MSRTNVILRFLPETVLEQITPQLRKISLLAGHELFSPGDRINALYFVRSGAVSLVSELSNGQMIETAMVGRDGVVGGGAMLDEGEAMYKAIVQVEGDGLLLDMDAARRLAREHDDFRIAVARHEQLVLAQAQQSAACNAAHNLHQRLARWLLRVSDATASDNFTLTQELMAEMLGVGRTSVSITANALQQSGLIRYRRGRIHVDNKDGLEKIACECYRTVKMRYDAFTAKAPQEFPKIA